MSNKLREIRKEKKIQVREICEKLDISRRTYYAWEEGICEPPVSIALRIAELLMVDPKYLFS